MLPSQRPCYSSSSVRFAELADSLARRKGARAAEWDGLENRCGFVPTVGSNPTPSAITAEFCVVRQRSSRTNGMPSDFGAPSALVLPGRLKAINEISVATYGTICKNACGMNVMFSACSV